MTLPAPRALEGSEVHQLRASSWRDALAGAAFTALLFAPVLLFDDLNAIALLFGCFVDFCCAVACPSPFPGHRGL